MSQILPTPLSRHSLTLWAPISQNGQTHSNNLSANCLSVFDHFVGLALKELRFFHASSTQLGKKSSARRLTKKVWCSTCTSRLCSVHKFFFAAIKREVFVGFWFSNAAKICASFCCGKHSLFPMTLAFFTSFRSVLLTRI